MMDFETDGILYTCRNFHLPEVKKFNRALDTALRDGTLSYDQLFAAICTIDDGGSGDIPYSMGTRWFCENARGVAAVFGQATYRWFLLDCGAAVFYHFAEVVVIYPEVLMTIEDPAWREAIASELYLRRGAVDGGWMKVFQTFINRDRVAELLLERLESVKYDSHIVNDIGEFLEYGDRKVWPFLTQAELIQVFRICADKAPSETYDAAQKLYRFLPDERIAAIRQEILPCLTCDDLSEAEFSYLSLAQRFDMLRARAPFTEGDDRRASVYFVRKLVGLAFDAPMNGSQFLREILWGTLAKADSTVVYRNARVVVDARLEGRNPVNKDAPSRLRHDKIVAILDTWLAEREDVFLGVVTEGRHRGQRQLQVVKDDMVYIHDRYAHRYFPQVGHSVLIKLRGARQLTPKVRCVIFLPVNSTEDVY